MKAAMEEVFYILGNAAVCSVIREIVIAPGHCHVHDAAVIRALFHLCIDINFIRADLRQNDSLISQNPVPGLIF